MRAKIKGKIAEFGQEQAHLLEARNVATANNMFWMLMDREIAEPDGINYQRVYDRWFEWFCSFAGMKVENAQNLNQTISDGNESGDDSSFEKLTAVSFDELVIDDSYNLVTNEDYFTEGGQSVQ
jgi:hypothetical protein